MTVIICDEMRADKGDLVSEELRKTLLCHFSLFHFLLFRIHLCSDRMVITTYDCTWIRPR